MMIELDQSQLLARPMNERTAEWAPVPFALCINRPRPLGLAPKVNGAGERHSLAAILALTWAPDSIWARKEVGAR